MPTNCAGRSADLSRRMLAAQQKATELAGRSLQPRFAQAARCAAVRRAQAAGAGEDARAARPRPTRKRWRRSPTSTSCRGSSSTTAGWRSCAAPTPTSCRRWSTRTPAACTPATTRPAPRPGACRRPIRTCRTSRSAPRMAGASAPPSSRRRAARSWPATTRRSSCGSWPTCPATRRWCARSKAAPTSTAPPRRKCSASRWKTSAATSAARPRRSTSA